MLQISDREDFATRLAYFMTAQQHLAKSGVQPTGESLQASTNKFLDQFTMPAQKPPFEPETKLIAGYVLKDSRQNRVATIFNRTLYRSEAQARTELEKFINESHHHLYKIVPVYL